MRVVKRERQPVPKSIIILLVVIFLALIITGLILWYQSGQPSQTDTSKASAETSQPLPILAENGMLYGGLPAPRDKAHHFEVLRNKAYVVGYSESFKDPLWVAYHLHHVDTFVHLPRPPQFSVDSRTSARVEPSDYIDSGYDRGHMCPNRAIAQHFGADAQLETFLMSNVVPQTKPLNEHVWERLETAESEHYPQRFNDIWIICGPVFPPSSDALQHLRGGVAIPVKCFKILIREFNGRPDALAFEIPQSVQGAEQLSAYLTPIAAIEADTSLNFLTTLPEPTRQALKSQKGPVYVVKGPAWLPS